MESDYPSRPLGELVENLNRLRVPIKESLRKPGKYPYYGAQGVVDYVDSFIFDGEFVLVAEDGENLRSRNTPVALLARGKFWVNNHAHIIRETPETNNRYLAAAINLSDISSYVSGSAIPKLTKAALHAVPIPCPSKGEQDRIAAVIQAIDDRIDHNRALAANLEAIARALFKSWFVDFDPVRAKAAGEVPPGLAPDLAALFPDRFVDSELGVIPEGWSVKTLDEALELNPRRSLPKGSHAPYLDMASTPTKGHVPDQVIRREFSSGTKFTNGDTLLARITPCLENGKAAFVDFLKEQEVGWGSTEFIVLRPKAPLPSYFGYLLARYAPFKAHAISSMSGTSGRQRVQPDSLATWELAVPEKAVAEAFGTIVEPLREAIACANEESRVLSKMRDLVLPRLISGKLRVEDAEAALEAA